MDKDFLIQTTNNLYRLTLFFPKKEPLRYKMREKASDILAQFLEDGPIAQFLEDGPLSSMLEVLNGFFEVAKEQNWVSPSDILVVQTAYINLGDELRSSSRFANVHVMKELEKAETAEQSPELMPEGGLAQRRHTDISERQKKILELLKERGRTQVHQVQQIFPQLTKRTLRRDFEQLLHQGLIQRIGERNEISYQVMVGQT